MTKDEGEPSGRYGHRGLLLGSALAVLFVVTMWSFAVYRSNEHWSKQLESLFGGLALVGVLATLILQSRELNLQRQELVENRAELRRQADAQTKMEITAREQARSQYVMAYLNAAAAYLAKGKLWEAETGAIKDDEVLRMLSRLLLNLKPQFEDLFAVEATSVRAVRELVSAIALCSLELDDVLKEPRQSNSILMEIAHRIGRVIDGIDDKRLVQEFNIRELYAIQGKMEGIARRANPVPADVVAVLKVQVDEWMKSGRDTTAPIDPGGDTTPPQKP